MNSITIFCLVPRRLKRRVRRAPNPTLPLRLLIWTPGAGGAKGNSLPQHKKCSLLIIYHTLNSLGKKIYWERVPLAYGASFIKNLKTAVLHAVIFRAANLTAELKNQLLQDRCCCTTSCVAQCNVLCAYNYLSFTGRHACVHGSTKRVSV